MSLSSLFFTSFLQKLIGLRANVRRDTSELKVLVGLDRILFGSMRFLIKRYLQLFYLNRNEKFSRDLVWLTRALLALFYT